MICWKGPVPAPSSNLPPEYGTEGQRLHRAEAGRHRHAHMEKASPTAPCLLRDRATSDYYWVGGTRTFRQSPRRQKRTDSLGPLGARLMRGDDTAMATPI
jgi:hypothetical protein